MNVKKLAPIGYGLLLLGLIAAPFVGAYPVFVMKLLCFALFATAFNLLLGYTGLLSFGHAAFLGGAAYVTGHAVKVWGATPELGLLAGTLSGALLGLVMGWFTIRRQGIYATMITLALAQMLFFAALHAVHRRRGWPAGRAARQAVRHARPVQRPDHVLRVPGRRGHRLPADRAHH